MARSILSESITFTPAAKTFNFNTVSGFNLKYLTAIVNATTKQIIYMPARGAGYGYTSFLAGILTVEFDTTVGMNAADVISYYYDDEAREDVNTGYLSGISGNTLNIDSSTTVIAGAVDTIGNDIPTQARVLVGGIDQSTDEVGGFETRPLNSTIISTDKGLITKSLLVGKQSGGTLTEVDVNASGHVGIHSTVITAIEDNQTNETQITKISTETADFSPSYGVQDEGLTRTYVDPSGNLLTRGPVHTDEGSYTANFSGSSVSTAINNCTFVNGSPTVTGTGFSTTALMQPREYIKLDADAESAWAQIYQIISDTELVLYENYTGSSATGATSIAPVKPMIGSGGGISVASGALTLTSGTTNNSEILIEREVDYLPLKQAVRASLSQRIANQTGYVGLYQDGSPTTAKYFAEFRFTGVSNLSIECRTGFNRTTVPSGSEIETTTYTIPSGETTTALSNLYKIEVEQSAVKFYFNGDLIAKHERVVLRPGDVLTGIAGMVNGTGAGSTTSMVIDYMLGKNFNKVDVSMASDSEDISVQPKRPVFFGPTNVTANNTDFFVIDCEGFTEVSLQISSVGGGGTVSFQGSNLPDFSGTLISVLATPAGGGAPVTSSTAVGHWNIPVVTRYLRIRTTAYTSGTLTANAFGRYVPSSIREIRTTYNGTQAVSQSGTWNFTLSSPNTGNGMSTFHKLFSAATTNATSVKGSAGVIGGIYLYNSNAAVRYFKLYNKASAPTVGTDTPVLVIPLPPNGLQKVDHAVSSFGMRFSTGIAYAITTGLADADTGAVGANDVVVGLNYT